MTAIHLKAQEVFDAALVGIRRRIQSRQQGRTPVNHMPGDSVYEGWGIDVEGAVAERALAKALGLYWAGLTGSRHADPDDADVGRLQVRTTYHRQGCLIIRADDNPDQPYILMVGDAIRGYEVAGWLWGHEAQQEQYLKNPNGAGEAWFVPQSDLHPVTALPKEHLTL